MQGRNATEAKRGGVQLEPGTYEASLEHTRRNPGPVVAVAALEWPELRRPGIVHLGRVRVRMGHLGRRDVSNLYLLCPVATCPRFSRSSHSGDGAILMRSSTRPHTTFCACPQTIALEFVPSTLERPYPHLIPAQEHAQ